MSFHPPFRSGTGIPLLLDLGAGAFLLFHPPAPGNAGQAVAWVLVVLGTAAAAVIRTPGLATPVVFAQLLVVFWSTSADPALLPARWLLHGALMIQACATLPAVPAALAASAVVAELVLVTHFIPGMTLGTPDPAATAVVLGCLAAAGFQAWRLSSARRVLEAQKDRNDQLHASVLQLTTANTEFLGQANAAGEESAVNERNRITRDLHDVVGQTLTNIIMMMDAALHRKADDPEETTKLLRWIRRQAQTGLEETRAVLYELRALRPAALRGIKALKRLIDTFERLSRVTTNVEWGNLPWTFDPDQETAVFHLVQGALSNAFRHGLATQIDIHFQVDHGVLNVMVRDNGRGGPDASLGLGQRGMEERLARWGGRVWFRSEAYGYLVLATLPLVEVPPKEAGHGPGQDPDR